MCATPRSSPCWPLARPLPAALTALRALRDAGVGTFSRIRLIEVKACEGFLSKSHADEFRDEQGTLPELHGIFAMKVMKKSEVARLKHVDHVKSESLIHSHISHPFIATLFHRYQDERNLYLVQEFVQGGKLQRMIKQNQRLTNETARFFAAQVVMAVQYLHSEHIAYRDLNTDNVMLDASCYVKLVDFGLAKVMNFDDPTCRTWTLCGTPEYLAPEIITSKGHSKEVDWWALGILIHEMLAGYPPYFHDDAFQVYQMVLNQKVKTETLPDHFETHAKELLKKLLQKEVSVRIGSSKNGAEDIKKHKWYRGLNWAALYNKQLAPPSDPGVAIEVPKVDGITDTSNFDRYPGSAEENGPTLEPERDAALFGKWDAIRTESDLRQSNR